MTDEQQLEAQQQEENQDERPSWLPEKFKSPEDLARSYGELESKLGQTNQQMREQQQQWEEFLQQQEAERVQTAQQQQQLPQAQEQLYAAYEQDPLGTIAWMVNEQTGRAVQQAMQQQAPIQEQQAANAAIVAGRIAQEEISARYPDWDQYRDGVVQEIENNPELYPDGLFTSPAGVEKAFDRAYRSVKLEALTNGQATLEERQAALAQNDKVNAQTLSGAAGRPDAPDDDEEFFARLQAAAKSGYASRMNSAGW